MPIFLWSLVVIQSTRPESRKRRRGAAIAPAVYAMLAALPRAGRRRPSKRAPPDVRHRQTLYQIGRPQTLRQRKEPGRPGTYRMLAIDKERLAWYGKSWSA